LETLEKAPRTLITVGVRSALLPANDAVVAAAHSSGSVTRVLELEPAPEPPVAPHCLWCDRTFTPRMTGESIRKFCCTDTGSSSGSRRVVGRSGRSRAGPTCLKASHTSVHAAREAFGSRPTPWWLETRGVESGCAALDPSERSTSEEARSSALQQNWRKSQILSTLRGE
jgi:hypothetical protein